jgi:hypothetical protein
MGGSFSDDYPQARSTFLVAVNAAGGETSRFVLDRRGPDGEELSTDVAWFGPRDARRVFVAISATHGVEGFYGSATQIEWLRRGEAGRLPEGTAALLIHALNPFGFAWLRRTNEDNVDINRNWVDFDRPLPGNPLYDELADDLCPTDWSPETQMKTGARLMAWGQRHGDVVFQQAVSSGQWNHPRGLFYGGAKPSWSRRTLTEILQSNLSKAARVLILDFHTGLGPYGYAEPIVSVRADDPAFARTRAWMGAAVKSVHGGGSISTEIVGDGMSAAPGLLAGAVVDTLAMECGIKPVRDVANALRADAWLHAHGDPQSPEAAPIKAMIRDAFHSDDPMWQGMALGQGLAACRAAVAGLNLDTPKG